MYSIVELEDIVKLEANQLDNIYDSIKKNLINNYEKKILGRINSYIIKISNIDTSSIKNGIISDINGSVSEAFFDNRHAAELYLLENAVEILNNKIS